jgi:predicted SnoaL-like aldol condensation-catalyzing enzyme
MYTSILSLLTLGVASTVAHPTSSPEPSCRVKPATPFEQADGFADFVQKLYVDRNPSAAYHKYAKADLINHSAEVPVGAAPDEAQVTIDVVARIFSTLNATVYHQGFDSGYGWVHVRAIGGPFSPIETALVNIFRWDGTCIVEHWDCLQQRPEDTTNSLAMF